MIKLSIFQKKKKKSKYRARRVINEFMSAQMNLAQLGPVQARQKYGAGSEVQDTFVQQSKIIKRNQYRSLWVRI